MDEHGTTFELCTRAGPALSHLRRHVEAARDWESAAKLTRPSAERIEYQLYQSAELVRARKAEAGVRLAEELGRKHKQGWVLYNVACVLAQASQQDATYAPRAMEVLEQTKKLGYFRSAEHRRHLLEDEELRPLRLREDYKRFVETLEKDSP